MGVVVGPSTMDRVYNSIESALIIVWTQGIVESEDWYIYLARYKGEWENEWCPLS